MAKVILYIGSGMASRQDGTRIENEIQTFMYVADSRAHAEGMALAWMQERFPSNRGYTYSMRLNPVEKEVVDAWHSEYQKVTD